VHSAFHSYRFNVDKTSVALFVRVESIDVLRHVRLGTVEVRSRHDDWSTKIASSQIVESIDRASVASFLMNTKAFVLWFVFRSGEQFFAQSKAVRRNAQVFGILLVFHVQRATQIGGKSPQFVGSLYARTEQRSVGSLQLIAILSIPELETPAKVTFGSVRNAFEKQRPSRSDNYR
jgi:hypothetical protein